MYICVCKAVTDKQIKSAIENGHCSRKHLNQCLGVGSVCGKCSRHVKQILDESHAEQQLMPQAVFA